MFSSSNLKFSVRQGNGRGGSKSAGSNFLIKDESEFKALFPNESIPDFEKNYIIGLLYNEIVSVMGCHWLDVISVNRVDSEVNLKIEKISPGDNCICLQVTTIAPYTILLISKEELQDAEYTFNFNITEKKGCRNSTF